MTVKTGAGWYWSSARAGLSLAVGAQVEDGDFFRRILTDCGQRWGVVGHRGTLRCCPCSADPNGGRVKR